MTRLSSNVVLPEAGDPQSGIATAAPPFRRASGDSPFYVEEPDIPEGVTCAEWRRRRRHLAKRGLLANVPWLRWHPLALDLLPLTGPNGAIESRRM